jgi:bifunctional non-homologous end joining protein LigD
MPRPSSTDTLAEYRRKRDFARTPEPGPKKAKSEGYSFVVQKHAARRLHYDFRLELDGVLKSWAVTKGPSLDPAEKRLAVRTEDHPLAYGDFEGIIPKGEYGGGTVMVWDRGSWEPVGDPHKGLEEGKLKFRLHGERMKGGWTLVRMQPKKGESRENWLLIKERDGEAGEAEELIRTYETSAKTGRAMDEIAGDETSATWSSNRPRIAPEEDAPKPKRARARKGKVPDFQPPQLATLVDAAPAGRAWLHELKYDGYRCLLAIGGGEVRCYSRNGLDWTERFGRIARAAEAIDVGSALIDGEIVAFAPDGRTDFSTLQQALSNGGPISCFVFDLLSLDGKDLRKLPLGERKDKLRELVAGLAPDGPIQYSEHVRGEGEAVLARICGAGHEGIVSKKADSAYQNRRSRTWVKVKCTRRQEFVIAGWTPSERRTGFASLILGAYRDGRLAYAGRVGTGFNQADLLDLEGRLDKLQRKEAPLDGVPRDVSRRACWVEPKLVAEIAYTEFTADGVLRHPSFLGLREDKDARKVIFERPEPTEEVVPDAGDAKAEKKPTKNAGAKKPARKPPAKSAPLEPQGAVAKGNRLEVAGISVSNPDRVLWPGQGVTKAELVAYYQAVAERMLAHGARRPLSLVRCPQGRSRHCFYQKHTTGTFPEAMKPVGIRESSGEEEEYSYFDDLAGIIAGVQMGVLEFHIWGSRIDNVEKPDRLVFDLDPDEGLDFGDVRRAAFDLRDRLQALGLTTFPMLTGGKGVHVVAPLAPRLEWPQVKAFARAFATSLAGEAPERYTANMSKAKRKGRIFLDYLRNDRGSTAICPYSTRRKEGAPVAAPVTWAELEVVEGAAAFDLRTMPARVRDEPDPWADYGKVRQSITKRMLAKVGAG